MKKKKKKTKLEKAKEKFVDNLANLLFSDAGLVAAKRDLNTIIRLAKQEALKEGE